jgi:hypothetical protein
MTNPFKSLAEDGDSNKPDKNQIKENIHETMRLKGFLFYLIEFFTAVFGASVSDNLIAPGRKETPPDTDA